MPDGRPRHRGAGDVPVARLALAATVFAALYAACLPPAFLAVMAALSWQAPGGLLFTTLALPLLVGLGMAGLAKATAPAALLVGAVAARSPGLHWPKLLAAVTVPLVDLLLAQAAPASRLIERGSLLLADRGTWFLFHTVAPLAACGLAALAIPQRLVRRLLGRPFAGSAQPVPR